MTVTQQKVSEQHQKRKKINLKVKRQFQRWLLIRISGLVVVSSLIAALILYFYARQELTTSFFDAHVKIRRVSDLLLPVVIAGSVVSLIGGVILAVFLPQKIAGPLFRIEQDLLIVKEGDLTKVITLRPGDLLTDFAGEVNEAIEQVRSVVEKVKDECQTAQQYLAENKQDSAKQAMGRLADELDRLKT
jgi:methyl-accepting chemotaxis protein